MPYITTSTFFLGMEEVCLTKTQGKTWWQQTLEMKEYNVHASFKYEHAQAAENFNVKILTETFSTNETGEEICLGEIRS